MDECVFLTRLPVELRLRIYAYVLSFSRPMKLRQVVEGTKKASILRANRQIYHEALPVFYDCNTIVASRNDFCHRTDAMLQTPLNRNHVRHLKITSFSRSIICASRKESSFDARYCSVCQPSATGFIETLLDLPRLRSAVVDYRNCLGEFSAFQRYNRNGGLDSTSGRGNGLRFQLLCTGVAEYRLVFPSTYSSSPTIIFTDRIFNQVWSTVRATDDDDDDAARIEPSEPQIKERYHRDLTNKLWFAYTASESIDHDIPGYERAVEIGPLINAVTQNASNKAENTHLLTELLRDFVNSQSANLVSAHLNLMLRDQQRRYAWLGRPPRQ